MKKSINLALQGGGAHGAFTWGVIDYLLEEGSLSICSISGTSAGAINAVITADGLSSGNAETAREKLSEFWHSVSKYRLTHRSFFDTWLGNWNVDNSPGFLYMEYISHFLTPESINPFKINPLRDILNEIVDFENLRNSKGPNIFIGTTLVETGKARVFSREELSLDVIMASACLPRLYKSVEIDGKLHWDGGYSGNPPLYPIIKNGECEDIVIIQINPILRKGNPVSSTEISNRIDEITFNQSLLKELRAIEFVQRLLKDNIIDNKKYRSMNIHIIESQDEMNPLGASSKMNTELPFLLHLKDIGRKAAARWIDENYDMIGISGSVNLQKIISH